ncbi:hypothetical protein SAMN05421819_4367 [Bryocella elongata]|uniref:Uncharacterized protein n=1 Tax=Bryocella elongata TaxID=863522 RepID=A0A1H6CA52_9BACT|nr:hypothetical protein [Bryocella elongata]SEG69637.1 hypothetical protein SAMN05421819_4367 [Bryocella elongata]
MDRVRFGRALGYGARHAAKSLAAAVDAATTPSPSGSGQRPSTPSSPTVQPPKPVASEVRAAAAPRAAQAAQVLQAGKQASRSVLGPVKKATGVVMLQVSGSFFGLLAFGMGRGLWALRGNFRAPVFSNAWMGAWVVAALVVVLSYFCVSNFVRASRRERS